MSDEIEMYLESDSSSSYIESLIKALEKLTKIYKFDAPMVNKLLRLIDAELDLALMGAEKAKSEILKADKTATVRPIK